MVEVEAIAVEFRDGGRADDNALRVGEFDNVECE